MIQRIPTSVGQLITQSPWHRVFAWALVVQTLNVAVVATAARSIGITVPLAGILVATTTASLAAALPISIAGVGIREASLPLLLAADGIPREAAIALGLAWSAIVLAVGLVGTPAHFAAQRRTSHDAESAASTAPPLRSAA